MDKLEKNNIKRYLKNNFSLKDAMMSFVKSLQNVADSSMAFYGFDKVPIEAKWDSCNSDVAWINDEKCYINLDNPLVKGLSFTDRKKCVVGEMAHEIFGHWLHTDFERMQTLLRSKDEFPFEKYFSPCKNYDSVKELYLQAPAFLKDVFFSIGNIVEDPVVEFLAVQKYPGFAFYIDFLKEQLCKELTDRIKKNRCR